MPKWRNPIQLLLGLFDAALPEGPEEPVSTGSKNTPGRRSPRKAESPDAIGNAENPKDDSFDGWDTLHPGIRFEFPPRLRKTWRLHRRRGVVICELPKVFLGSPDWVRQDLLKWIHAVTHPSPVSRRNKKQSQTRLFEWMSSFVEDAIPKGKSHGVTWDLQELFDGLNQEYFGGTLQAVVRWSPQVGGLSTHRKIQNAHGSHHVLTISKGYDGDAVPRYAVEGVLYHEMCHIAFPPKPGQGSRRHVHHKEFREAERRYRDFQAWREWEAKHLHRQLKILRRSLQMSQK